MASINGVRGVGGAALPAAGAALGGAPPRVRSPGHGGMPHAALSARPPGSAGNGAPALRAGLGKISQDIVNRMAGGGMAKTTEELHQVPKSAVLQGTYSAASLSRAMDATVKGLASLRQAGLV